jgi:hypothetical protein
MNGGRGTQRSEGAGLCIAPISTKFTKSGLAATVPITTLSLAGAHLHPLVAIVHPREASGFTLDQWRCVKD